MKDNKNLWGTEMILSKAREQETSDSPTGNIICECFSHNITWASLLNQSNALGFCLVYLKCMRTKLLPVNTELVDW